MNIIRLTSIFFLVLVMLLAPFKYSFSGDVSIKALTPTDLSIFAKDLNNLISYRNAGPAEPSGLLGFEFKALANFLDSDNDNIWNNSVTGGAPSTLTAPQIVVTKGLPYNFDLSARTGKVLDTELKFTGAFVKYSILEGTMLTPALSVGLGFSKITGGADFDASQYEAQTVVSKGFANFTPYAGFSWSKIEISPHASTGLAETSEDDIRSFAGFRFSFLPLAWMNLEYGKSDVSSLTASFSLGF